MPSSSRTWLYEPESKPAPEPLVVIQALVNTMELETGLDRLDDIADARQWLHAHGLSAPDLVAQSDLRQISDVREAIRAMLIHNAGGPAPGGDALGALRQVAAAGVAELTVDDRATIATAAEGNSVQAWLVGLLLVVRDAQRDGTWSHLKACANHECQWAFYDRSRNHGGTWCDMATCGNKLKNRDFRARQRTTSPN